MNRRVLHTLLAITIVLVTGAASWYFLRSHPQIIRQLGQTSGITLATLLGLYCVFMGSLWLVFRSTLVFCRTELPAGETLLVTAYSSIINFFGPLQSGPAFRALYLKKRHAIGFKLYAHASLVYYLFYAFFSGVCLLVGVFSWKLSFGVLVLLGVVVLLGRRTKLLQSLFTGNAKGLWLIAGSSLLQVLIFIVIFYVELHNVNQSVSWRQAVVYTGAANFALFVSLTPGAIGFREAFVLLAQRLHHLPTTTVVSASLLDRGVYVGLLLILAVIIFGTHARSEIQRLSG